MAVAFFSTWTTYGTWLPGDQRGWFRRGSGLNDPDRWRESTASLLMTESAVVLDSEQRLTIDAVIREHCEIRKWELHAVNCRSNHVHVVVTANERRIALPREQFKAWGTRRLKDLDRRRNSTQVRMNWWSQRGWDVYIDTDKDLEDVVAYVLEGQ